VAGETNASRNGVILSPVVGPPHPDTLSEEQNEARFDENQFGFPGCGGDGGLRRQ
jgi:hypothetical protein